MIEFKLFGNLISFLNLLWFKSGVILNLNVL